MARNKKTKYESWMQKNKDDSHFLRMYDGMIFSDAYIQLSSNARSIYILLRANLFDTGHTAKCPYKDILKYTGIRKNDIRKYLEELIALGFIKIYEEKVKAKNGVGKPANIYEFVDTWKTINEEHAKRIKKELKQQKDAERKSKERAKERIKQIQENY